MLQYVINSHGKELLVLFVVQYCIIRYENVENHALIHVVKCDLLLCVLMFVWVGDILGICGYWF
jgi:hypothetical protein